ncbi:pirin family protein [Archangium lansingense]|uniref:pirin family protein n=1 Tax=Archangium lansingense TaxID=2995310 RepID=UPI003B760253
MSTRMVYRNIASVGGASKRPGSYEFSAANLSSRSVGRDIDPVIGIDHFHIRAPVFAPHPHAGFSAVTYLFEDGEGEFINRDSLGDRVVAHPGAVIWTVTGSGVLHEEYPATHGKLSHGLQIFVNLPAAEKLQAPRLLFVDGPDVPVRELPGARVRVVTGNSGDVRGKLTAPGDITLLDVKLEPGAAFDESFPADHSVLAYVIKGSAFVGREDRRLGALEAASFAEGDGAIRLRASPSGAQVVLLAGRPLREPVVSYGPFVMNTEQQLAEAFEHYRAGGMGSLAPANGT